LPGQEIRHEWNNGRAYSPAKRMLLAICITVALTAFASSLGDEEITVRKCPLPALMLSTKTETRSPLGFTPVAVVVIHQNIVHPQYQ
jgi:hypothetical protein